MNLNRCSLSMKQISRTITTNITSTPRSTRTLSPSYKINKQSITQTQAQSSYRMLHSTTPHYISVASSSSPQVEQIFQKIIQLDTIEVHLLTELVNEKLGFQKLSPAQREAAARGGGGGGGRTGSTTTTEEEKVEMKTIFDLKLIGFDEKTKIKVIKEIRAITGLGLKEAKEMVEGVPKVVKKDIKMEEAQEIKAKLEAVGATVEIS